MVSYNIKLDVDKSRLNADQLSLLNAIQGNKAVDFSKVTNLVVDRHKSKLKSNDKSEFDNKLSTATVTLGANPDPLNIKSKYEKEISIMNKIDDLIYNKDSINVNDILSEGKTQCFSGTELYLIALRRSMLGSKFRKENIVAIHKSGHVLPGKMVKIDNKWQLWGVETTGAGDALLDLTSELDYGKMIVVDAEIYHLTQIFKGNFSSVSAERNAAEQAIELTAKKYSFNSAGALNILNESYVGRSENETSTNSYNEFMDHTVKTLLKYNSIGVDTADFTKFFKGYSRKSLDIFFTDLKEKIKNIKIKTVKSLKFKAKNLFVDILDMNLSVLKRESETRSFNSSSFSFGSSDTEPGNKTRNPVGMSYDAFNKAKLQKKEKKPGIKVEKGEVDWKNLRLCHSFEFEERSAESSAKDIKKNKYCAIFIENFYDHFDFKLVENIVLDERDGAVIFTKDYYDYLRHREESYN